MDFAAWQNAIFAIPLAASAVLLILSSIRLGGHHGMHHGGGGHAGHAGHAGHGAAGHAGGPHAGHSAGGQKIAAAVHNAGAAAGRHAQTAAKTMRESVDAVQAASAPLPDRRDQPPLTAMISSIFSLGRAPLLMVLELFFISWGFVGLMSNQLLIGAGHRGLTGVVLLSIPIAFGGGLVVARLGAALIDRMLPKDETWVTSRDSLFGLVGEVTYEITAGGGRVHVYDAYGTLHDEACRGIPGAMPIAKGGHVMIDDIDKAGNLIVREISV